MCFYFLLFQAGNDFYKRKQVPRAVSKYMKVKHQTPCLQCSDCLVTAFDSCLSSDYSSHSKYCDTSFVKFALMFLQLPFLICLSVVFFGGEGGFGLGTGAAVFRGLGGARAAVLGGRVGGGGCPFLGVGLLFFWGG